MTRADFPRVRLSAPPQAPGVLLLSRHRPCRCNEHRRMMLRRAATALRHGCMTKLTLRLSAALVPLLAMAAAPPPAITPMTPDVVDSYNAVLQQADFIKREAMVPMRDGTKFYT